MESAIGIAPGSIARFEQEVKNAIGRPRYELWFRGNTMLTMGAGSLEIGVPNRFYRDWLENHFQEDLRRACQKVFGDPLPIRFRIDPALFRRQEAETKPKPLASRPPAAGASPARPSRFDLGHFIAGAPNRVAHAAATALIENPRRSYSPLFVFGGIGLGKSHLLKATELGLKARHRELKVLAMAGEEFTNEFLDAMRTGKLTAFRRKVRQTDVLVVDDVQFLSGKRATQEELLHTLNALDARGGKAVFAADSHPRRLAKFAEELRARFVSGIVAKLEPPNREMRRHILRNKAAARRLELRPEVAELLAENLSGSVGELEGALNYLEHYCETLGLQPDLATARTALAEILRHSVPIVRVAEVVKRACDLFGLSARSLKERSRARTISHPRMLVLYLARKYTPATYSEIGQQIGALNHSTVIAAEKKIREWIESDAEIVLGDRPWKVRDAIEAFERELGRG